MLLLPYYFCSRHAHCTSYLFFYLPGCVCIHTHYIQLYIVGFKFLSNLYYNQLIVYIYIYIYIYIYRLCVFFFLDIYCMHFNENVGSNPTIAMMQALRWLIKVKKNWNYYLWVWWFILKPKASKKIIKITFLSILLIYLQFFFSCKYLCAHSRVYAFK